MSKPILQAMVLCERYYHDRSTGKRIIAGTFNNLHLPEFPTVVAQEAYLYLCLTGVRGDAPLQLRFVDLQDNEVLAAGDFKVTAGDPLDVIEFAIPIPPLPFENPGVYSFEIVDDSIMLGSWRLNVYLQKPPESEPST